MNTQQLIEQRRQAARKGSLSVADIPDKNVPGLFAVTNAASHRCHRVVYHGVASSWNSCDCFDFRANGLGTCKHIEAVVLHLHAQGRQPETKLPRNSGIDVCYIGRRRLRFRLGTVNAEALAVAAMRYFDDDFFAVPGMVTELPTFIEHARRLDNRFYISSDALALILDERDADHRRRLGDSLSDGDIAAVSVSHRVTADYSAVRRAFAAGRVLMAHTDLEVAMATCLLTTELIRSRRMAMSALIVCPTSLKYQWRHAIGQLTGCYAAIIEGAHEQRRPLYDTPEFYKIVSYHSLANDIKALGTPHADVLVLDHLERIDQWNKQVGQAATRLDSDFCFALSGSADASQLDALRRIVDPFGDSGNIMRLKASSEGQATILHLPLTREQQTVYDDCAATTMLLARKWRELNFLSEKDRKRLMISLSQMMMVCGSTFMVDAHSRYDTKIVEAMQIIRLAISQRRGRIAVFSRWNRMLRLLGDELNKQGISYIIQSSSIGAVLGIGIPAANIRQADAQMIINLDIAPTAAVSRARAEQCGAPGARVISLVAAGTLEARIADAGENKLAAAEPIFAIDDNAITIDDAHLTTLTDALLYFINTK